MSTNKKEFKMSIWDKIIIGFAVVVGFVFFIAFAYYGIYVTHFQHWTER